MGSDFNAGATVAQFWRTDYSAEGVGLGQWSYDHVAGVGLISAFTADGELSEFIQFISEGDQIQFCSANPLAQGTLTVSSFDRSSSELRFYVSSPQPIRNISVGQISVLSIVKEFNVDSILTDEDGQVLVDSNGNVLIGD